MESAACTKDSAASFLSSPDRPPSSFSIPVRRAGTKEIPCSSLDKKSIAISPFVFCDLNSRAEPPVVELFPPAIMYGTHHADGHCDHRVQQAFVDGPANISEFECDH